MCGIAQRNAPVEHAPRLLSISCILFHYYVKIHIIMAIFNLPLANSCLFLTTTSIIINGFYHMLLSTSCLCISGRDSYLILLLPKTPYIFGSYIVKYLVNFYLLLTTTFDISINMTTTGTFAYILFIFDSNTKWFLLQAVINFLVCISGRDGCYVTINLVT